MPQGSQEIVRWLPYLRRYARALTGSRRRGDAYVQACLEVLVEEPQHIKADTDVHMGLFKLFRRVWRIVEDGTATSIPDESSLNARLRSSLSALPPTDRQILLLSSLEEFSADQIGEIMDMSPEEVTARLDAARDEVHKHTGARVLIIEDDAIIAADIARIVGELGHTVIGIAARERNAIDLARRQTPELVLADIQLKDGDSGLRAVRQISDLVDVPVIFVTSYPERLLSGADFEPAFVITKPFAPDTLQVAINHALKYGGAGLSDRSST